ncbi:hypothetical protein [Rosistilla oblonga]|uniref:hypothetical protein n=1 Tax=Rosistilla oblonga TaxID=2527990 RepID=UPI003A97C45D
MSDYKRHQERNALLRSHAYRAACLAKGIAAEQGDLPAAKGLLRNACGLSLQAIAVCWTGSAHSSKSITQHAAALRENGIIDRIGMQILQAIDENVDAVRWKLLLRTWMHLDELSTPTFQRESRPIEWSGTRAREIASESAAPTESEVQS